MAKVLLLGTWLTGFDAARSSIERNSGEPVSFGGMAGQIEVSGTRIAIERDIIVNDRTWKHGIPRSVQEGRIEEQSDGLFVVVDEPAEQGPRRG